MGQTRDQCRYPQPQVEARKKAYIFVTSHLLKVVCALSRFVKDLRVLKVLDYSLDHGERLGEVDRNRDFGEVFADTVLHDGPQTE